MKKGAIIIIASTVVAMILLASMVIGALGIGATLIANKPENVAAAAIKGTMDGLLDRKEIKPLLNTLSKGSITASVSDIMYEGEDMMDGFEVSGKVYFSEAKKSLMIEDLIIQQEANKLQGDVYISPELAYVYEQNVLDGAYGAEFGRLTEEFKNSIFAYNSGSEYAIDYESYEEIVDMLEIADQAMLLANDEKMQKEAEKVSTELYTKAWKIACDNFKFDSENGEVRIDGELENVRVISIIVDADGLSAAVREYYEFLSTDDSMVEFLEKYEDELSVLTDPFLSNGGKSFAETYKEGLDELGENLDDLCHEIEYSMEDENLTIRVMTPVIGSKLVKLEIIAADQEIFSLEIGMKGIKNTNKITVTVYEEKFVYEITQDTITAFDCYLAFGENRIELELDRSRDEYRLFVRNNGETSSVIRGQLTKKGDTITITVDNVLTNIGYRDDQYDCNISVTLDQNDKIPAAPKDYVTISGITEKDIEKWEKNAEKFDN